MELKTHIEKSGFNVGQYAEEVGVSPATIYNAINGTFSPDTAQKIFDYTIGKVELVIKPKRND